MIDNKLRICFDVTKDALADVCEALYKMGVTNGNIAKCGDTLTVSWIYRNNRGEVAKQEEVGTNSSKKANGNSIGEILVTTFANPIDAIVRNHGIQWKREEVISYNLLNNLAYTKDDKVYSEAALYKGNECFIGTTAVVGNTLKEYVQKSAK